MNLLVEFVAMVETVVVAVQLAVAVDSILVEVVVEHVQTLANDVMDLSCGCELVVQLVHVLFCDKL